LSSDDIDKRINFVQALGFIDYVKLETQALCVISDSGTITEEASILNLPAITVRQAHERPEGMDEGTLIMSGLKKTRVLQAVRMVTSQFKETNRSTQIVADYQAEKVSQKVVRIILSYIDYVNRTVWYKTI